MLLNLWACRLKKSVFCRGSRDAGVSAVALLVLDLFQLSKPWEFCHTQSGD